MKFINEKTKTKFFNIKKIYFYYLPKIFRPIFIIPLVAIVIIQIVSSYLVNRWMASHNSGSDFDSLIMEIRNKATRYLFENDNYLKISWLGNTIFFFLSNLFFPTIFFSSTLDILLETESFKKIEWTKLFRKSKSTEKQNIFILNFTPSISRLEIIISKLLVFFTSFLITSFCTQGLFYLTNMIFSPLAILDKNKVLFSFFNILIFPSINFCFFPFYFFLGGQATKLLFQLLPVLIVFVLYGAAIIINLINLNKKGLDNNIDIFINRNSDETIKKLLAMWNTFLKGGKFPISYLPWIVSIFLVLWGILFSFLYYRRFEKKDLI